MHACKFESVMSCQFGFRWLIAIFAEVNTALFVVHTHIHIILIYMRSTRLLETARHSRAPGTTCSIQMPWLQIKAWGGKVQRKPGRVTHIQLQWLHPRQLDGFFAPHREHSNFLTSASASCQLEGLAPLRSASNVSSSLSASAHLFPMLWWEMSSPRSAQIVWRGKWCLRHWLSCHDTSCDTEKNLCLSALISNKRGGGQRSLAILKVLPLSQWQNKTKPLY